MSNSLNIGTSLAIGDLFEMDGRRQTIWSLSALVTVPRTGVMAEISQVDGTGRLRMKADYLVFGGPFRRIRAASL